MLKKISYRFLLIFFLASAIVSAQDIDSLLAVLESHREDEAWLDILSGRANYHLIYFQMNYDNNSYFSGRDVGLEQFNLSAQVSYNYKQITATVAAVMYEALYPPVQTTALSLMYRLPLKFPLDIDLRYDRYFYLGETDTSLALFPNGFGLGLSYRDTYWGASADMGLYAGADGVTPQILTSAYGNFNLFKWNTTNRIAVRPEIIFDFGTEATALSNMPGLEKGNGQGPPWQDDEDPDGTVYEDRFGLLNTEINIHLLVYLGDLDVTFSVRNNQPRSLDPELTYSPTSLISLSLGYSLSFIGK